MIFEYAVGVEYFAREAFMYWLCFWDEEWQRQHSSDFEDEFAVDGGDEPPFFHS